MKLHILGACGSSPAGEATSGYLLADSGFVLAIDLGTGTFARLQQRMSAKRCLRCSSRTPIPTTLWISTRCSTSDSSTRSRCRRSIISCEVIRSARAHVKTGSASGFRERATARRLSASFRSTAPVCQLHETRSAYVVRKSTR